MWRPDEPSGWLPHGCAFQYRKRYEVTCDVMITIITGLWANSFQYRKRYEVTCDCRCFLLRRLLVIRFQYRKRYEVTCDKAAGFVPSNKIEVSIPQAVWGHMWLTTSIADNKVFDVSIPQAVWGHMWHLSRPSDDYLSSCFNTASGMRSHVTLEYMQKELVSLVFQYRKRYEVTCDNIKKYTYAMFV